MNRIALYAALMLTLAASAAQAQTPSQRVARDWGQTTSVDGRQLIAALDACQQLVEQSHRTKCEMTARKTGGQGMQLRFGAVEPTGQFDRFHP